MRAVIACRLVKQNERRPALKTTLACPNDEKQNSSGPHVLQMPKTSYAMMIENRNKNIRDWLVSRKPWALSSLPLLVLVRKGGREEISSAASSDDRDSVISIVCEVRLLDGHTHVTAIAPFATVALILADAALDTDAGVLAASAGSLTVAALLTFTAPLATRLSRQVLLVNPELMLEVDRRSSRRLTGLRWKGCWRHRDLC